MTRTISSTASLHAMAPQTSLGGLLGLDGDVERPFPLRVVKVRSSITGNCCRTEVSQRFANPYNKALEATHMFPLPEDGAIVEMEMRAGTAVVKAVCLERKEAEAKFTEARESGHRAALLTQERADIHTMQITNIPPLTDVWVRIVIVERLNPEEGKLIWRFPTVIAPRFIPGSEIGHIGQGISADTDAVPDASRISPPISLSGGARLDLEIRILGAITSLTTSFPAERVDRAGEVHLAPSSAATTDRDFVLTFTYAQSSDCTVSSFTDGKHTLVMVEPPAKPTPDTISRDAIFVLDRSGSMEGPKLAAAKQALLTALRQLRYGDRFAILAFSSSLEVFNGGSTDYSPATFSQAQSWIQGIEADGGTEMLEALNQSWKGAGTAGRVRTIVLITDAESGDEDRLSAIVAHRPPNFQLFAIGIDSAVNTHLLKKLTRLGGGAAIFLSPEDGDLQAKISKFMESVGKPVMIDVTVENEVAARPGAQVIFAARSAAFLLDKPLDEVTVLGQTSSGSVRLTAKSSRIDFPIGPLWAREHVLYLEDKLALLPMNASTAWLDDDTAHTPTSDISGDRTALLLEIRNTALAHNIASRCTAFVAVDEKSQKQIDCIQVVQPVASPYSSGSAPSASSGQFRARTRSMTMARAISKPTGPVEYFCSISAPADASMDYLELEAERSIDANNKFEGDDTKKWVHEFDREDGTKLSIRNVRSKNGVSIDESTLCIPREESTRHIVVVGRGGNSSLDDVLLPLLYSDCMESNLSTVVVGTKPEISEQLDAVVKYYSPHKEVVVFNPFDVDGGRSWSILSNIRDWSDAKGFVKSFIDVTETPNISNSNINLLLQAQSLLMGIVTGLLEDPNESLTMSRLIELVDSTSAQLTSWLERHPESARLVQQFISMVRDGSTNAVDVHSYLRIRFQSLNVPEASSAIFSNSVDIDELIAKPMLIIIEVPENDHDKSSPFYRLIVAEMIRLLTKRADAVVGGKLPRPISIILPKLDYAVGFVPDLAYKMGLLRTRNICIVAGFESITAVQRTYGEDTQSLLSSFSCRVIGPLLDSDTSTWTREEIAWISPKNADIDEIKTFAESCECENSWMFVLPDGTVFRAEPYLVAETMTPRPIPSGNQNGIGSYVGRIMRRAVALLNK